MNFYMPSKVYQETSCVKNHAAELAELGSSALLVTGKHSAVANGSLNDVIAALDTYNVKHTLFDEIEENPSVETVVKAADLGLAEECDMVIGIGGGSPMDAAKAIALLMTHRAANADATWELLFDASADSATMPIVCVPTTCGTGSEVTGVSVLTRHDLHTKMSIAHKIFPDLSLIDGKYLETAPASVLENTTMDALAHLLESAINSDATDYSRMCVNTGLEVWARSKDAILADGDKAPTAADHQNMMTASMMAGMAIAHTGTSLPHGLSYALTYNTGMAHGKACGYFLGGYLAEAENEDPALILELLDRAGFDDLDDFNAYFEATCGREEVPSDILELSVKDLLDNPKKMLKAPFPVDEEVLRRICGLQ